MKPNILVIGDVILDHYIWGGCERISPEAPVQVIEIQNETQSLGGACNVANNLICLGACVWICGLIGDDEAGNSLLEKLNALQINTQGIIKQHKRPTTQKSRILANHQQVLRVDKEDKSLISSLQEQQILDFVGGLVGQTCIDCIILSDYGKGLLTTPLTQKLIAKANAHGIAILIDPKGSDYSKYKGATLLTPNKKEAKEATNIEINNEASLMQACQILKERCNLQASLITLSEGGIAFFSDELHTIPTIAKEVFDVTGAGDTVIASLGFMLALKQDLFWSVYFANAAAAVVVSKIGSATATKEEIYAYLKRNNLLNSSSIDPNFLQIFQHPNENAMIDLLFERSLKRQIPFDYQSKLIKKENLESFFKALQSIKDKKKKIVFTNGCFDILHFGHVHYLNEAKSKGDLLIIGLNSDRSVRALKGEHRPINSELDRAFLLCGLECVDFVILFEEPTPLALISQIKPDILVKAKDYQNKEVVGSMIAKELCLVDFIPGHSTTSLIQSLQGKQ